MKKVIKTIAFVSLLGVSQVFAHDSHEKMKAVDINEVLPKNIPSIETQAPEKNKISPNQTVYSATQKAAIVELELKSQEKVN